MRGLRKDEKVKYWKEKALHGAFVQQISYEAGEESWRWLRNGVLKEGNRFDSCCSGTACAKTQTIDDRR